MSSIRKNCESKVYWSHLQCPFFLSLFECWGRSDCGWLFPLLFLSVAVPGTSYLRPNTLSDCISSNHIIYQFHSNLLENQPKIRAHLVKRSVSKGQGRWLQGGQKHKGWREGGSVDWSRVNQLLGNGAGRPPGQKPTRQIHASTSLWKHSSFRRYLFLFLAIQIDPIENVLSVPIVKKFRSNLILPLKQRDIITRSLRKRSCKYCWRLRNS